MLLRREKQTQFLYRAKRSDRFLKQSCHFPYCLEIAKFHDFTCFFSNSNLIDSNHFSPYER
jgi:hypothetical protein